MKICVEYVCDRINADNVIDALLLADRINNEKLMSRAKVVFVGYCDSFGPSSEAMKKLETNPKLLVQLLLLMPLLLHMLQL